MSSRSRTLRQERNVFHIPHGWVANNSTTDLGCVLGRDMDDVQYAFRESACRQYLTDKQLSIWRVFRSLNVKRYGESDTLYSLARSNRYF